jgi:DNA-binding transcriptional regulator GbsR (MarR family)
MESAQRHFVDRMGMAAEADGLSPIASRLFAVLLLADGPLSLDELAATLGVSKASVSTDARRLLERGVVERVTHAGDRRDYYELAADSFARITRARLERWRRMHALIADLRAHANHLPAAAEDRLAAFDDVHTFVVEQLESALDAWEQRPVKRRPRPRTRNRSGKTA